jgi:hypothetical protein
MRTAFIALVLWLVAATAVHANPLEAKILSYAVYIVTAQDECSGVVITTYDGIATILTARHCLRTPLESIRIGGKPAQFKKFGVVALSKNLDLATIQVLDAGHQNAARFAPAPVPVGGTIAMIGLSFDVPWAPALGFVMGQPSPVQYDNTLFFEAPFACMGCDEGMSGAGVFNAQGELSGVYVAQSRNNVRAYMVPLSDIRKFLH